jgi:hypothetical protein
MSRSFKKNAVYSDKLKQFRQVSRQVGKRQARRALRNVDNENFSAEYAQAIRRSFAFHPVVVLEEGRHDAHLCDGCNNCAS